ncbi:hypothetical protein BGZ99_005334 [Dissophora globulifera]|uniref:RlpA-like protein double-psi beta-barrel domain-containing protein n=1 Tax=Dissophora globulifera TaxID=979702 RepID=A0A9P6RHW7_9FUNG|nr:hypothetical protein BGZ99_005334 [Dissophora globulifera]
MAPIPRLAAGPLSIITGALLGAFSGPNSTPPSNGSNATLWDTEYRGTASFLNLTLHSIPTTPTSTISTSPSTPTSTASPSSSSSPSLVYFDTKTNNFTGCNNQTFTSTDNVAFMNPLQFGNSTQSNSTCGDWIQIKNRANTAESTYAKIVGVCDDCDYGSVSLNLAALNSLAPDLPFDQMVFNAQSNLTIDDITDPTQPLPASTPISPEALLDISWSLSAPPSATTTSSTPTATTTTAPAPAATTQNSPPPPSTPSPKPTTSAKQYTGRATWYSDTFGQCEKHYSQSDLIVAVNQAQMGTGTSLCGKKIRLTEKGSDTEVIVTVVDMCPSAYCNFGDLDLSQAAFQKFAGLGVGILQLQWSFV